MATENQTNRQVKTYHTFYLHGAFQHLIRGLLDDWFCASYYDQFAARIVSTYTKAIQQAAQDTSATSEGARFHKELPSILMDPMSSDLLLNQRAHGYDMWRFEDFSPQLAAESVYVPFIKTDDFMLYQMSDAIQLSFDIVINTDSMYESMDHKRRLLNWAHGLNKPFYKENFPITIYSIIPAEMAQYIYENFYRNGYSFPISNEFPNVPDNRCRPRLIETINKTEMIIEFVVIPYLTLNSVGNVSEIYGNEGIDRWGVNANFTCECELPTFLTLYTDWKLDKIDYNLRTGNSFSRFGSWAQPNTNIIFPKYDPWNFPPGMVIDKYFYHIFTDDTPFPSEIPLPVSVDPDCMKYTRINTKDGYLIYGKGEEGGGFYIDPATPNILELSWDFAKDDLIEVYIYKKI